MSLTATIPSQAVAEWIRIFPKQVTETYTNSVTFMKQITTVAVSTVSYLKNIFPEENYKLEKFGGVTLRILKKNCKDELAQFLSTALAQAFEAFEKKYLHKLALCFYDGECDVDSLIEYHVFEYAYTQSGVTVDVTSKNGDKTSNVKYTFDNVREKTVDLIQNYAAMVHGRPRERAATTCELSLRLYYNEDAPEGYQAPGFLSSIESEDHLAASACSGVLSLVGGVDTPFHRVQLSSYMRTRMALSHEAQPSQNPPIMTQSEADFNSENLTSRNEENSAVVECPCGRDDSETVMLTCQYCGKQQHAECFGLLFAVRKHCCIQCSDADPTRQPTDDRLAKKDPSKREPLCMFRRTLAWCCGERRVGVAALVDRFHLSQLNANKLIKLLRTYVVIEGNDTDIMSPRKIISEKLKFVMSLFFTEQSEVAGPVLPAPPARGSRADPVGDVLGPMQAVSLHNASAIGKIIEPPQDCIMQDATLKQYKDAILSNQQTEELPLSGNHNPVKDMELIGKKRTKRKADNEARTGVTTKRAKRVSK